MCIMAHLFLAGWRESCVFSHRYEHRAVVGLTQLGDTVQEDGGHLLVLVLNKAEDFEGEASHLTLAILEDCGLWVFFTAGSRSEH